MPQQDENLDADFDSQLRGLFHEAEQHLEDREATRKEEKEREAAARLTTERAAKAYVSVPQMLRPMVLGLEAVTRATGENTVLLNKLDKFSEQSATALQKLPTLIGDLENLLDQKSGLNQRMFDAMHEELKGYKDAFLLDSVHKPIIRDLISLFDDLEAIHRQMQEAVDYAAHALADTAADLFAHLKTMDMNVMHNCDFIIEVLARLEVTPLMIGTGKLDKQTQRAVALEVAEHPDADADIVRSVKRGFSWKGRVLRPEEVVIKKWKDGLLVAMASTDSQK